MSAMPPFRLVPGDVLVYNDRSIVGWIIRAKTWHSASHVEIALGGGKTFTSRIPFGARIYPFMRKRLVKVLRPVRSIDADELRHAVMTRPTAPYGWGDLTAFIGWDWDPPGEVCSAAVTEVLRMVGLDPFDGEPSRLVAPFQFDLSNCFTDYPIDEETEVLP